MTTFNTGNPLGSTDVYDRYDNSENLDNFSNGPLDAYADRLGVMRQSWAGMEAEFDADQVDRAAQWDAFLLASGYQVLGPYGAGLVFTAPNQVFSYLGEFYAPGPSITLPYTTTGVGAAEIANFRSVGDAVLRSDLANNTDPAEGTSLIGYKGRTVYQRLSDVVSVMDFGAKGDGTTDDTSAIQACANYVASLGGGVIWFPGGKTYKKSATLNITSSHTEVLMGQGASIVEATNGYTSITFAANLTNIKATGLRLFGITNNTPASMGYGIFTLANCTVVRISDCIIAGYTGGIGCLVNNRDVSITNCRFADMTYVPASGVGGYGILSESNSAVRISNNHFANTVQRHHIYVGRNAADLVTLSRDFTIIGNTFESLSQVTYQTGAEFACKIMATQDVTIVGNTFRGGCGHVWMTDTSSVGHASPYPMNIVVEANTFAQVSKGNSINAGCVVSTASYVYDVTVANNKMYDNATIAHVYFSSGGDIRVSGNTIYAPVAGHGIASEGAVVRMSVENNRISVPAGSRGVAIDLAVAANSPGTVVKDNWISGGLIGVSVFEGSDAVIDSNIILNTTQSGVQFLAGTFTGSIRHNVITTGVNGLVFPATFVDFMWVYGNRFAGMSHKNIDHGGTGWLVEPISDHKSNLTTQRKKAYNIANTAPSTGTWNTGDVVDAVQPPSGGYSGFICVIGGTPGTWKGYGLLQV